MDISDGRKNATEKPNCFLVLQDELQMMINRAEENNLDGIKEK
eukprot:COSAG01_NODE_26029_length_725_cov_3.150160_3_plen_42_part_01